ncbi:hypothetical protein [Bradyrhizobium sp. CCGUVB14]|uniref:hypothetical protein n=1 Tax=Bradyrhizobium sp. CCGUVB14 TaxID=2949628 RepID=UPI0020B37604|nr:hypothetical protein [Bradyrhizobium sp. CCGUVB14]MCP3439810.1 hypothetical protein [Bradyrhizobium sp. CCGUVB14]
MTTITIGKRLIPLEHIALLEPFDPSQQQRMQSERPFQTRLVLVNRDSVLSEDALATLAEQNGFRIFADENIATNPAILFSVEGFEAEKSGDFQPTKPYRSRLLWRDPITGKAHSKLLLAAPEDVLATVVRGEGTVPSTRTLSRSRKPRRRSPSPL